MNNFYGMTKEELILMCKRLKSESEKLQDELDRLSDCYTELENQCADTTNTLDDENLIKDIRVFKYRLMINDLLTPQLESFIDTYLKYYNETME